MEMHHLSWLGADCAAVPSRLCRYGRCSKGWTPAPSNEPKQRIIAHGQHKSASKTRRWAATQGKAKVMDDQVEPRRHNS